MFPLYDRTHECLLTPTPPNTLLLLRLRLARRPESPGAGAAGFYSSASLLQARVSSFSSHGRLKPVPLANQKAAGDVAAQVVPSPSRPVPPSAPMFPSTLM